MRLAISAGFFSRNPISPVRDRSRQPMRCPARIRSIPLSSPNGANKPPVMISASEMAAPAQRLKRLNVPSFLSLCIGNARCFVKVVKMMGRPTAFSYGKRMPDRCCNILFCPFHCLFQRKTQRKVRSNCRGIRASGAMCVFGVDAFCTEAIEPFTVVQDVQCIAGGMAALDQNIFCSQLINTLCCLLYISGGDYLESRDFFGLRHIGSKDICKRQYLVDKRFDGIRVHEETAIFGDHHGVDHDMLRPVFPAVSYTHLRAHETRHDL